MKIGLVTHTFSPEFIGGRENHVQALAELLAKKHDIYVFTGSRTNKVVVEKRNGYKVYNIPLMSISLPDNEIYRIIPKFLDTLKKEDLDIIHAHDYGHFSTDVATIFSMKRKIPMIMTIHGHYFKHPLLKTMKGIYDRFWGYKVVNNSKKIVCVSETQKQEISQPFNSQEVKNKITIIPNGINIRNVKKTKNTEKIILSMGRLVYRKGFHTLIEAAKYINDAKVIIVGPDGGERDNLTKMIRDNNLNDKVEIIDAVMEDRRDEILSKCSIFAIPSLYEGLPTTLLEAMLFGKPVVCSDLLGIRNVVKDGINGFLVRSENSKMLAQKINLLLEDKKLSRKIGERNQKDVRNYDWKKIVKDVENTYHQVI